MCKPLKINPKSFFRRGQATVEFALVATILLALVLGVVEVGRVVFISNTLSNAAREGAHYLALHGDSPTWQADATQAINSKLFIVDPAQVTRTFTCDLCYTSDPLVPTCALDVNGVPLNRPCQCMETSVPACSPVHNRLRVSVTVNYTWRSFVPLLGFGSVPLSALSTAPREQ
jgi:Flp pilus assembly protein TadG